MSDLVKVTGLFRSTSKAGKTYYGARVGNTRLMVFKNEKKGDNDPDLVLMVGKVDDNAPWTKLPKEGEE